MYILYTRKIVQSGCKANRKMSTICMRWLHMWVCTATSVLLRQVVITCTAVPSLGRHHQDGCLARSPVTATAVEVSTTTRYDVSVFSVHHSLDIGRPNAPTRLTAMSYSVMMF
jgi:hypothetical protein